MGSGGSLDLDAHCPYIYNFATFATRKNFLCKTSTSSAVISCSDQCVSILHLHLFTVHALTTLLGRQQSDNQY